MRSYSGSEAFDEDEIEHEAEEDTLIHNVRATGVHTPYIPLPQRLSKNLNTEDNTQAGQKVPPKSPLRTPAKISFIPRLKACDSEVEFSTLEPFKIERVNGNRQRAASNVSPKNEVLLVSLPKNSLLGQKSEKGHSEEGHQALEGRLAKSDVTTKREEHEHIMQHR
jgi:hypothetical protein